jgi:TRAP-type C4-dicarboxylate transport system substrate-binding protein
VYSRANLSRTVAIVVAPFFTAISTRAFTREFRDAYFHATDFRDAAIKSSHFMREKWRALGERSHQQANAAGVSIVTDIDRKPFEAAMARIYAKARQDPAAAGLIARIRKVE